MNIAVNSPSHGIETSLLSYSNPSSPTVSHASIQHAARDTSRSLSPHQSSPVLFRADTVRLPDTLDHEDMEEPPASMIVTDDILIPPPPPPVNRSPLLENGGQNHDRIDIVMDGTQTTSEGQPGQPLRSGSNTPVGDVPSANGDLVLIEEQDLPGTERPERESTTNDTEADEESGTEASTDDENAFLVNFEEDTTSPNDEELKEIESKGEVSATEHDHWQAATFDKINDPEYTVNDTGRIEWSLKGFHGTIENPNKERMLKSPSVVIGGFLWDIKLFPRGTEDTDQLSVFIECLGPVDEVSSEDETDQPMIKPQWNVPAQIGCVLYNPAEPRVNIFERGKHHFEFASEDFGWVRFHGPWDGIHRRQRLQRQPLLRNDTLAFTAYIRTFNDPTGALWWQRSANPLPWNCLDKTGYRDLIAPPWKWRALVAALAAWLHLKPFRELILTSQVPNPVLEPTKSIRPLLDKLQKLIHAKYSLEASPPAVSLQGIADVLKWYDRGPFKDCGVTEMWAILKLLIEEECSGGQDNLSSRKVLDFIVTLRQSLRPDLLSTDMAAEFSEACNTQEVLDRALREECNSVHGIDFANLPTLIQLELRRQDYNVKERRWRRLTHRVEINETVKLKVTPADTDPTRDSDVCYTLYGFIVHSGALGSDNFSAILRPNGPGSKWLRYSGRDSSRLMNYTTKQAIEAHEGNGDSSEGTQAIAYIVLYVQSKLIPTLMLQRPQLSELGVAIDDDLPEPSSQTSIRELSKLDQIPVEVIDSSAFIGWEERGIVDLWSRDRASISGKVFNFKLSPFATLCDVQKYLVRELNVAAIPEQCRLYCLDITVDDSKILQESTRSAPPFRSHPYLTELGSFAPKYGGCRLWLHILSIEQIPIVVSQGDGPIESPVHPDSIPLSDGVAAEVPPVDLDENQVVSSAEQESTNTEDIVMGGTQVEIVPEAPAHQTIKPYENLEHTTMGLEIYCFAKIFDARAQTLRGIRSFIAFRDDKVGDSLERNGITHSSEGKVIFIRQEVAGSLRNAISYNRTFGQENLAYHITLVIEEGLPQSEMEAIESRGGCTNAHEYYEYLTTLAWPTHQGDRHVQNEFGSGYINACFKYGRQHGHTIRIETSGDNYVGNSVAGHLCGRGTMNYANGDTYSGNWDISKPDGVGTMVYAKTGNEYVGGWKNGRRHGKGIMRFEVADEEMQLCKICYEVEMDALFYRCGHVAACEECAKQVSQCPVCRRSVDAVVRIWKT